MLSFNTMGVVEIIIQSFIDKLCKGCYKYFIETLLTIERDKERCPMLINKNRRIRYEIESRGKIGSMGRFRV